VDFEDYVVRDPQRMSKPIVFGTHSLEDSLRFPRGWVEVNRHIWSRPAEYAWTSNEDVYLVNFALSPRPAPTMISHVGSGRRSAPRNVGRILLIPPSISVQVGVPETGRLRSMRCAFDYGLIENILQCRPKWSERLLQEATHLDSHQIEWLMLHMYRELRHRGFASELAVESFATALAVEVIRYFRLGQVHDHAVHRGGLDARRLRLVRERAYADAPAPGLTELAELCSITVRQLSRGFKAQTGHTIGKFVEAATLERARTLLSTTDLPIGEIARRLGFSTSASFAYAFRRSTGFSPGQIEGRRRVR
jgi:AraC family transcriptional regulator